MYVRLDHRSTLASSLLQGDPSATLGCVAVHGIDGGVAGLETGLSDGSVTRAARVPLASLFARGKERALSVGAES